MALLPSRCALRAQHSMTGCSCKATHQLMEDMGHLCGRTEGTAVRKQACRSLLRQISCLDLATPPWWQSPLTREQRRPSLITGGLRQLESFVWVWQLKLEPRASVKSKWQVLLQPRLLPSLVACVSVFSLDSNYPVSVCFNGASDLLWLSMRLMKMP